MLLLLFRSDDVEATAQQTLGAVTMDAMARERFVGNSNAVLGEITQTATGANPTAGSQEHRAPWFHEGEEFFNDIY
jgi:hypothetical protein